MKAKLGLIVAALVLLSKGCYGETDPEYNVIVSYYNVMDETVWNMAWNMYERVEDLRKQAFERFREEDLDSWSTNFYEVVLRIDAAMRRKSYGPPDFIREANALEDLPRFIREMKDHVSFWSDNVPCKVVMQLYEPLPARLQADVEAVLPRFVQDTRALSDRLDPFNKQKNSKLLHLLNIAAENPKLNYIEFIRRYGEARNQISQALGI